MPGCNLAMRDGPWKLYWPRIPEAMVKLQEDNAAVRELMTRPHYEMPVTESSPPTPEAVVDVGNLVLYTLA